MNINIHDLNVKRREKHQRDREIFNRVLKRCHMRIRMSANQLSSACMYTIPPYIPGLPLFQINDCLRYIKKKLKANGFKVKTMSPTQIYISWGHVPIEGEEDFDNSRGQANTVSYTQKPKNRKRTRTREQLHPSNAMHPSHRSIPQFSNDSNQSLSASLRDFVPIINSTNSVESKEQIHYRDIGDSTLEADSILFNI